MNHTGNTWGACLLIAGTAMGAGMLALPIVTGLAGFYPAIFINLLCWLFMLATGLLFLEATLWLPDGANVLTISRKLLGPIGQWVGGAFFLFLYYCLMVAYLAGGSLLFKDMFSHIFPVELTHNQSFLLFTLFFALVVYGGAKTVDRINWILMAGLIIAYFGLIGIGSQEINTSYLTYQRWSFSWLAAPVLFAAYGYHNIIPSLSTYLKRNTQKLRIAIIIGTTIPFIVYTLWQWVILGSIPVEQLQSADNQGVPVSELIHTTTGNAWVGILAMFFGFFALVTSLIGVALSMVDFLGDGTGLPRTGLSRIALTAAVFLPPAIFCYIKPGVFIEALGVAGGIGEAFLNGLLPIALVFAGRYVYRLERNDLLPGGKPMLALLTIFTIIIMALEAWHLAS